MAYRVFPAACVAQVRQIQRLIATGFSLDDILGFPDCMRLVEGAQMCPETAHAHRARLQLTERQLADLERRRTRLLAILAQGDGCNARPAFFSANDTQQAGTLEASVALHYSLRAGCGANRPYGRASSARWRSTCAAAKASASNVRHMPTNAPQPPCCQNQPPSAPITLEPA